MHQKICGRIAEGQRFARIRNRVVTPGIKEKGYNESCSSVDLELKELARVFMFAFP